MSPCRIGMKFVGRKVQAILPTILRIQILPCRNQDDPFMDPGSNPKAISMCTLGNGCTHRVIIHGNISKALLRKIIIQTLTTGSTLIRRSTTRMKQTPQNQPPPPLSDLGMESTIRKNALSPFVLSGRVAFHRAVPRSNIRNIVGTIQPNRIVVCWP